MSNEVLIRLLVAALSMFLTVIVIRLYVKHINPMKCVAIEDKKGE